MGTRSTIAIQNEDGTVTGIYCHWDGYLSHNGDILQKFYTTEEKVRALIALGDLSSLGEQIGSKHDFNNAPDGECNAYGRDRGETNIDAKTCASWAALAQAVEQRVMIKLKQDLEHWANDIGMKAMFVQDAADGMAVCELLEEGRWREAESKIWDMDTAARDYVWEFIEAELGVDELEFIRTQNG